MVQMSQQGQGMDEAQKQLQMEQLVAQFIADGMQQVKQLSQQVSGQGPDPLVKLKEAELQQRAQEAAADDQLDQAKLQLDAQNQAMRSEQFDKRLASQERQTDKRIDSAMQRELLKMRR
tara:strand:- start:1100 stop:1456 length:357 start_codon:yes stop_codon:yes gene_type:complete